MSGKLYGIGVGPGDPELLTLKAVRLLQALPVIAWPELPGRPGFAHEIAAAHIPPASIPLPFTIPMTTAREPAQRAYDAAAAAIGAHLEAGRDVGVLCEGDPLLYGSFMYLLSRLASCCPVEVVPGVSSLGACAAAARLPLAGRKEALTVIPATRADDEIAAVIAAADAIAIPKVGRHLGRLKRIVTALGLEGSARLVIHASLPSEAVLPLAEAAEEAPYFSMILIRKGNDSWL